MPNNTSITAPFDKDLQFAAKRRSVIISAAGTFRRKGYHNTSMAEIAESLNLTKTALYYYVSNKEEILYECHLMAYTSMEALLKGHKNNDGTALDQLETIFRGFVELLTQSGVSLLTDVDSLNGERQVDILQRRSKIEKHVIKFVQKGQKDGSIRSGNARLYVFFFMGALNWLNAWYDAKGRLSGEEIADHFVMQLRSGIAA